MSRCATDSIALRIVVAAAAVALVGIAIVGVGVWLVGGDTFAKLMATHGEEAAEAHAMFDESVTRVLIVAIAVAVIVAGLLAGYLGARIAGPLVAARRAAARIARGEYSVRVPHTGSAELVSLAESFNQMAAALADHERSQREFIANAAHELRTPLTNLAGYLEALRDGVIAPERQVFESLGEEVDRLIRLARSLDQLAADDAVGQTVAPDIDVGAAVRSAVELARPAAQARRLVLAVEGADAPIRATADADRLAQVMANLLQNAIAYTSPGGRVTVRCDRRRDELLISVSNTGEGIPAGDLAHVFERFYRVEKSRDRRRGGAGIGLAIVRQLVESAGGRVGAESSDGLTRVWFTVPLARADFAGLAEHAH